MSHPAPPPTGGRAGTPQGARCAAHRAGSRSDPPAAGAADPDAAGPAVAGDRLLAGIAHLALGQQYARSGDRARADRHLETARWHLDPGHRRPAGAARPASRLGPLSTREREIALLVREGCRNREIAAALFVSHRTVEAHISRILDKLGVPNRAALAALVSEEQSRPSTEG